ncbi:MAG: putative MxaK protein, partial [Proteobacteria bacterium]|nr:putative MxaK protein [Pseudomonadota bacterium]
MAKLNASLPAWWYAVTLVLAGTSIYEAHAWYTDYRLDEQIAHPSDAIVDDDTPPRLLLAKAAYLEQSGQPQEAIRLYHTLLNAGDLRVRELAHYNLATLYLSDAARLWNAVGVLEYARVN